MLLEGKDNLNNGGAGVILGKKRRGDFSSKLHGLKEGTDLGLFPETHFHLSLSR